MQFTTAFAALALLLPALPSALAYNVTVFSAPIEGCAPPTDGTPYLQLSSVGDTSSGCVVFETFQSFYTEYNTCTLYTYEDAECGDWIQEFVSPQDICHTDPDFTLNSFQVIC